MKKIITIVLCLITFPNYLFASTLKGYEPDQLLVQIVPDPGKQYTDPNSQSVRALSSDFAALQFTPVKLLSRRLNIWLFAFDAQLTTAAALLPAIKQHPSVRVAQLNHKVTRRQTFPDDPGFAQQWALHNIGQGGGSVDADIDAPEAWDVSTNGVTATGDTIVVAIVDGGFDLTHPDLHFWRNWDEIPGNSIDDDNNGYVDDYRGWNAFNHTGSLPIDAHGTHVSGIAAARGNNSLGISGVNWGVQVMPIAGSSTNEATVVEAYGYVLEMRSRYNETDGEFGAFIVSTNASFGVDYGDPDNFPLWCGMYDALGEVGILSCGATANQNLNVDVSGDIPTACPSPFLISVTNTTNTDQRNGGAAYGLTTIDLGSPGTNVYSTLPGSYGYLTGTSMATPHVTGAVGLMYSAANAALMRAHDANPGEIALLMKDYLLAGTDSIPALQGITVTGGRLNIYNALLNVQGYSTAAFEGYVADEAGQPLPALMSIDGVDLHSETIADSSTGFYHFDVSPGYFTISAALQGYSHFQSEPDSVAEDSTQVIDITLSLTGPAPQNLTAISEMNIAVPLSWEPPLNATPASYNVYRRLDGEPVFTKIASRISDLTYEDTDVLNGHAYIYVLTAWYENPDGESFFSASAQAVPGETHGLPYEIDFETDNGAMYEQIIEPGTFGATWEFGEIDPSHGPGVASSGTHLWATGLATDYANGADTYLLTPFIDLTTAVTPWLRFQHWYSFEGTNTRGFDGGNVAISTDAGDHWTILTPLNGYPDQGVPGLDQEPGFTGASNGWLTCYVDLQDYMGQVIMMRFRFGSDLGVHRAGWFIDDVTIADMEVGIEDEATNDHLPQRLELAPAYPNPVNQQTVIAFSVPTKQALSLRVYNAVGQFVRTLADDDFEAGAHRLVWDGRTAEGQIAANGVYLYQLTTPAENITRKMILLR